MRIRYLHKELRAVWTGTFKIAFL